MTTFEDILCKGKNAAECVGKKATDLVEVTKLKMEAAETEKDIASTLEGLGRLVYDGRKSGQDVTALTEECIAKIDEMNAKVAELRGKIDEYNNVVRCPQCSAVNTDDSAFCKSARPSWRKAPRQTDTRGKNGKPFLPLVIVYGYGNPLRWPRGRPGDGFRPDERTVIVHGHPHGAL